MYLQQAWYAIFNHILDDKLIIHNCHFICCLVIITCFRICIYLYFHLCALVWNMNKDSCNSHGGAHWRNLADAVERSVHGCDEAYVKLLESCWDHNSCVILIYFRSLPLHIFCPSEFSKNCNALKKADIFCSFYFFNLRNHLWTNFPIPMLSWDLQCFDAVGWAAGRASGL